MILHLVRHPKPLVEAGVCYGRLDIPAENPDGVAAAVRERVPGGLPVWSSPLRRCLDLASLLHPAPEIDERLVEMNFGRWEGRAWDDIPRPELDAWAADVAGYAPPGGESARELQRRALDFVAEMAEMAVPEAVIVTHAGVIRTLLAAWRNLPPGEWTGLRFDYASCTRVVVPR